MNHSPSKQIALGGVLAALAIAIQSIGTLIPLATFVCPMLCTLLQFVVLRQCGFRIAWAWYGAVALLGLLLAPDKEAAAVFLFLGYYPMLKPRFDRSPLKALWKGLLFNGATLLMYSLLIGVFGLEAIGEEFRQMGTILCAVMLLLGNVVFFLLDRLLELLGRKFR